MKKLWFLAPFLLLLAACAPQPPAGAAWGPEALEHFQLTQADVAGLEEMAQDLNQRDKGEAASLGLTQAIGDGKTIFVFYELTLPQGWGARVAAKEAELHFDTACHFSGKPLQEDPLTSHHHPYNSGQSSRSEPEGDTVRGFFSYDFRECYTGQGLTLYVGNLSLTAPPDPVRPEGAPPVRETCGDLLSLSWTPTNQAATVTASAPPQGVACTVTPLRLEASVSPDTPVETPSYYGLGPLFRVAIQYADGRTAQGHTIGSGGSDEKRPYTVEIRPKPGGLFHPEQVETVSVEGVSFRFGRG